MRVVVSLDPIVPVSPRDKGKIARVVEPVSKHFRTISSDASVGERAGPHIFLYKGLRFLFLAVAWELCEG